MEVQLTINTTDKQVEMVNYFLGLSISAARLNPPFKKQYDISSEDLDLVKAFQEKMLEAFLKPATE